jgi:hypothetical protein
MQREHLAIEILPNGDLIASLGVGYGEGVGYLDL